MTFHAKKDFPYEKAGQQRSGTLVTGIIVCSGIIACVLVICFVWVYCKRRNRDRQDGTSNRNTAEEGIEMQVMVGAPRIAPEIREKIPRLPYNTSSLYDTCPICLEEFTDEEEVSCIPSCTHIYHPHCLDDHLDSSGRSCPYCRQTISIPEEV